MNNIDEFRLKRELGLTRKDIGELGCLLITRDKGVRLLLFWQKETLGQLRKSGSYYVLELYNPKGSKACFQRHLISVDSKELVCYLNRFKQVFLGLTDNKEQLKAWREICLNGMKRSGERFMLALEDFGGRYDTT